MAEQAEQGKTKAELFRPLCAQGPYPPGSGLIAFAFRTHFTVKNEISLYEIVGFPTTIMVSTYNFCLSEVIMERSQTIV